MSCGGKPLQTECAIAPWLTALCSDTVVCVCCKTGAGVAPPAVCPLDWRRDGAAVGRWSGSRRSAMPMPLSLAARW
ncbi:hypothetical protein LNP74_22070 [Klebsiella pneumoniae subsp. pneumoniae]|nr:hypothetical protein [Klebsiella pneumoniae subsp. pneumoniae]